MTSQYQNVIHTFNHCKIRTIPRFFWYIITGAVSSWRQILRNHYNDPNWHRSQIPLFGYRTRMEEQIVPNSVRETKQKAKKSCCGPECDTDSDDPVHTLHRFPGNNEALTKWLSQFPNIEWTYVKSGRLCSKRFRPEDYKSVNRLIPTVGELVMQRK